MVRAPGPRTRVTLSSTCLAAVLALTATASTAAVEASPGSDGSAVASPVPASPPASATATLTPAQPTEVPTSMAGIELPGAEAITSANGRYVVVGTVESYPLAPVAWTSTDGTTWEQAAIAGPRSGSHMMAVTPTGDGFVALGYERDIDGGESDRILAWHSNDGTAWEPASVRRPASRGFDAFPAGLADGPAGQLALGSFVGQDLAGQRLWRSVDGQAWEPAALPDVKGAMWYTIVPVPDGYVLLGERGPRDCRGTRSCDTSEWRASNWHSVDGTTWTRLRGSPGLTDLAAAPDGTVVGIGGREIWQSSDLVAWEPVWSAPKAWALDGASAYEWVRWAGDRFLVTGYDYGSCGAAEAEMCMRFPLLESADGRTWTRVNGPEDSFAIDSDEWLQDVASDGDSTVLLGMTPGGPAAWLMTDEPPGTITRE